MAEASTVARRSRGGENLLLNEVQHRFGFPFAVCISCFATAGILCACTHQTQRGTDDSGSQRQQLAARP